MTTSQLSLALMTSRDVEAAITGGMRSIIIPCGAIEQHGAHLPLCVDADHADRLAVMIAERLGRTLVAPTIKVGCSSHHMGFAGTISLRNETFEAVCRDYCESLAAHGFNRILLFSAHVGNCPVLADILPRLRAAVPGCDVQAFSDSSAWLQTWKTAVEAGGGDEAKVGGHADIAETSFMLVLRPESVQMGRAEPGRSGMLTEQERHVMWQHGLRGISPNGILGNPQGATADIGEHCLTAMADLLAAAFSTSSHRE
jgi:creatinine amidohydrolase